jgi:hypothetical protein
MGVRIKSLLGAAMLSAVATVISNAAMAQDRSPVFRPRETVPEAMNRAYYGSMGDFSDRNPFRSIGVILGTPFGFPENQTSRDAERMNRLYKDLLNQQVSSDPLIRTADLPNPYNLSVLTLPSSNNRVMGTEFSIEEPFQPTTSVQPSAQALPQRF